MEITATYEKIFLTTLVITVMVMVAACGKAGDEPSGDDIYKKTTLFTSDETILEGQNAELTSILTDDDSAPLAGKKINDYAMLYLKSFLYARAATTSLSNNLLPKYRRLNL